LEAVAAWALLDTDVLIEVRRAVLLDQLVELDLA